MSIRQIGAALAALGLVAVLTTLPTTASAVTAGGAVPDASPTATGDDTQPIAFTTTTQTATVGTAPSIALDVGDWWQSTCIAVPAGGCDDTPTVELDEKGGSTPLLTGIALDAATVRIDAFDLVDGLHAGTHVLTATCEAPFTCATTTPLTLTVSPAPLTVDGRVQTDDAHPTGAVVTALLSGAVLDQYEGCECTLDPAGTWSVAIEDAAGRTVITRTIPVAAGGSRDTSFYWNDVPRDAQFRATFSFAPSGRQAADFDVTSDTISYASPAAASAPVASTPDPQAQTPERTSARTPTLPLWLLVALGMLALAALVAIAVLVVRLALGPVLVIRRDVLDGADDRQDAS